MLVNILCSSGESLKIEFYMDMIEIRFLNPIFLDTRVEYRGRNTGAPHRSILRGILNASKHPMTTL